MKCRIRQHFTCVFIVCKLTHLGVTSVQKVKRFWSSALLEILQLIVMPAINSFIFGSKVKDVSINRKAQILCLMRCHNTSVNFHYFCFV